MNCSDSATICALATPNAMGAIAVVRMSGPESLAIANKVFRSKTCEDLTSSEGYRTYYGTVNDNRNEILDQVLLSVYRAPHSYTGEDSVEISCHGSLYIQQELVQTLIENGARMAGPGEFSQRAFLNGKMDLAQAEAVAELISSGNRASHRLALSQMRGTFSGELSLMRSQLLELASLMELELDFAEEDVDFADKSRLQELLQALLNHIRRLCDSFRLGNVMKKGVPVAIAGLVNAGKSTLLNAFLGEERAIVSPVAGTTRDTIEDTLVIDGIPFRFIDTAGLRNLQHAVSGSQEQIEQMGVERSMETIRSSSIILLVIDASRPETFSESVQSVNDLVDDNIILVINKSDKISNIDVILSNIQVICRDCFANCRISNIYTCPVSAQEKTGIDELKTLLVNLIRPVMDENTTLLTNLRHFQALKKADESLSRVIEGLRAGLSNDLLAPDLREAIYHIGSITGEITPDDILGNIFSNFCIGK